MNKTNKTEEKTAIHCVSLFFPIECLLGSPTVHPNRHHHSLNLWLTHSHQHVINTPWTDTLIEVYCQVLIESFKSCSGCFLMPHFFFFSVRGSWGYFVTMEKDCQPITVLGSTVERCWKSHVNMQMSERNSSKGFGLFCPGKASLSSDELEIAPCYGNALFFVLCFLSTSQPLQMTKSDTSTTAERTCTHTHIPSPRVNIQRTFQLKVLENVMVAYQFKTCWCCHTVRLYF